MHGDEAAYNELRAYTLGRADVAFCHQYVVDTYAVQTANEEDSPIRLAQALIGLYLHSSTGLLVARFSAFTRSSPTDAPNLIADIGYSYLDPRVRAA